MIYSMTGYGKSSREIKHKKVTVEVRTLNSKSLDLNLKYPPAYREKEAEMRNLVSQYLDRGKVDFWMNHEDLGESSTYTINKGLVAAYYNQLKEISTQQQIPETDWMQLIFKMPDVIRAAEETITEEDWAEIRQVIEDALKRTSQFRESEGKSLQNALFSHVDRIEENMAAILPFEEGRIVRLREKIKRTLGEHIGTDNLDHNRFEEELVYYFEKLDISEEKIRLKTHCDYFRETMNAEGYNGKKLNFITQEMGREINTLGSKANEANIQKLVVFMKDELEKIKEQVLNVL